LVVGVTFDESQPDHASQKSDYEVALGKVGQTHHEDPNLAR